LITYLVGMWHILLGTENPTVHCTGLFWYILLKRYQINETTFPPSDE